MWLCGTRLGQSRALSGDARGRSWQGRPGKAPGRRLPQIDRLLDLRHSSRLDAPERAFAALGREMEIVVRAAA